MVESGAFLVNLILDILGWTKDAISATVMIYIRWLARFTLVSAVVFLLFGFGLAFGLTFLVKTTTFLILGLAMALVVLGLPLLVMANIAQYGLSAGQKVFEAITGAAFWILGLVLLFVIAPEPIWTQPGVVPLIFLVTLVLTLGYVRYNIKFSPKAAVIRAVAILIMAILLTLVPATKTAAANILGALNKYVQKKSIQWTKTPNRIKYDLTNIDHIGCYDVATGEEKFYFCVARNGHYLFFDGPGYNPDTGEPLLPCKSDTTEKAKAFLIGEEEKRKVEEKATLEKKRLELEAERLREKQEEERRRRDQEQQPVTTTAGQSQPQTPGLPSNEREITIPPGTRITVRSMQTIPRAENPEEGDEFEAVIEKPIEIENFTIPQGTPVTGTVRERETGTFFSKKVSVLTLENIILNQVKLRIQTASLQREIHQYTQVVTETPRKEKKGTGKVILETLGWVMTGSKVQTQTRPPEPRYVTTSDPLVANGQVLVFRLTKGVSFILVTPPSLPGPQSNDPEPRAGEKEKSSLQPSAFQQGRFFMRPFSRECPRPGPRCFICLEPQSVIFSIQ